MDLLMHTSNKKCSKPISFRYNFKVFQKVKKYLLPD